MIAHEEEAEHNEVKILVIDDEEVIHHSMKKILSRRGYQTEGVFSAKEGLKRLHAEPFDLVITDLMMPGMNGVEFLKVLEREQIDVPIIMVTGYPTIRTAIQAMRLGALDYLAKPFTRKELLSPVMRALRREPKDDLHQVAGGEEAGDISLSSLAPGDVVFLPNHTWARFVQDGTFLVGIEATFLDVVGELATLSCPKEMELVDQGTFCITMTNTTGEDHGTVIPLSGQVLGVNHDILREPSQIQPSTWLLRMLPSQLEAEIRSLVSRLGR